MAAAARPPRILSVDQSRITTTSFSAEPEALRLHDHACQIDPSSEVQLATAASFLRHGLERGEMALYVTGEVDDSDRVRHALLAAGVPPVAEMHGTLRISGPRHFQLHRSPFDPEEMLDFVRAQAEGVRAAGAPGLRVVADMTWTFIDHPGSDRFLEFEARVDDLFRALPLAAICQYHAPRFGSAVLAGALRTHRIVVARGAVCANPHHLPPADFLGPSDPAAEVERMIDALVPCGPAERVPICARCGGVPHADGRRRFEDFAADRFGLRFAHDDCPECRRRPARPV